MRLVFSRLGVSLLRRRRLPRLNWLPCLLFLGGLGGFALALDAVRERSAFAQGSASHVPSLVPPPPQAAQQSAPQVLPLPPQLQHAALPRDAIKRLQSGDPAQIRGALDDVRIAAKAGAPAVPTIVDLLARGMPADATEAAIDALGDTESETASAALTWYARHRNVAIRRSAVLALARTRGVVAINALRAGLSDVDPAVRGLSATGLGTLKAKEAIADLFVALDHKVEESSRSIGLLCTLDECDKLAAKLGSQPFGVVTSGIEQALFRFSADVSDDIKVKLVARVRELGTGEANRFLHEVQAKWPKRGSQRVKQAIDQAVLATSGSPGAGGQGQEGKAP